MTSTITVKVHPDAVCTFEKIAAPHEAPPAEINCFIGRNSGCYLYCIPLGEWGIEQIEKKTNAMLESRGLMLSCWVISGLAALGHLGLTCYLMSVYKDMDTYNIAVPIVCTPFTFLFILTNSSLYRRYITKETFDEDCHAILIFFSIVFAFAHVGLSIAFIPILFCDGYTAQGIISCIFLVLGSYGIVYYALTVFILFITWLIIAILESIFGSIVRIVYYIFYYTCCKDVCIKEDSQAAYDKDRPQGCSLYYYDKNKTTVSQCSICLCDFKPRARICVGICHATHIFHAKCLNDWLKNRSSCPICTSTSGFR